VQGQRGCASITSVGRERSRGIAVFSGQTTAGSPAAPALFE
jgi:hypothetical protein